MNFDSFLPWTWAILDPKRTQAARAYYDVTGKYAHWHAYCRRQFQRESSPPASELAIKGVEVVRVLSVPEGADVKALLLSKVHTMDHAFPRILLRLLILTRRPCSG